ncbi:2-hydroxyacid dehydrogenase [Dasania sp. GY-MA-18]|uniref:2-hydroxyacid dehydrogenase n=1 Tax=Dasania phycosphaerae TaxID=2950436 RepID=A0A9J6RRK9_9GAMM|nr:MULTISPECIES: 2-hydroxyacid dehydrogenase [Dasania]MCR8924417.1 2-hydroxyacid dehydrogenase [Dasania sp. GY-MA-18]MCZ0867092.1 2-hydroxyacid dehydrogenase [Dasania phycosphaerae]MCZ0870544.1 2-hydroxyacid dehydrogenase [Dasania phycosphaerae]
MKTLFFSSKPYDKKFFTLANHQQLALRFVEEKLSITTVNLLSDETAVCVFVNDIVDKEVITALAEKGVKLIALRCAGVNNVDLNAAAQQGIKVVRVAAYSPHAVAEHTLGLMLSLNRKMHRAYNRTREGNFALEGLLGFDFYGRTLGIIGTGNIGAIVATISAAMGMQVIAHDPVTNPQCVAQGVDYVSMEQLFCQADVISIHCPLTPQTQHLIDAKALAKMKTGVMIINTSRGAVLDTSAIIDGLKSKKIAYLGLDVYEQESELFFEDLSSEIIQDDIFGRLLTFPNVLITAHQGFFTEDALTNIADTTLTSLAEFSQGKALSHQVKI